MTDALSRARRERLAAVVLCGLGAAAILLAAGRPWAYAVVDLPPPLPTSRSTLSGRDVAPQAAALGLAGLAGLAGLLATRGLGRVLVGASLVLLGLAAATYSALGGRVDRAAGVLADRASGPSEAVTTLTATPWWWVSLAGGVLLAAAGGFAMLRGRRWPGMSARYHRPGTAGSGRGGHAPGDPAAMWEELDRGGDPTADPPSGRDDDEHAHDASEGKGS